MATLAITTYVGRGPDGYPTEGTYYRFYCDSCGSFHISRFIPPATWLALLVACALIGAGWQCLGVTRLSGADWLWWWSAFAILCAFPLSAVLAFHGHRCDNCGNTAISNVDVLHYSQRQDWAYDLPYERLHTHDKLRNRWYKELLELLVAIVMVPVVMLFTAVLGSVMVLAAVVLEFRPDQRGRYGPKNG